MQPKSALKKVDGSMKDVLQTGFVDGEAPIKNKTAQPVEELSESERGEKLAYQRILKQLVPDFPIGKLEKQTLGDLKKFFEAEVSPIIQESILTRYKNISP